MKIIEFQNAHRKKHFDFFSKMNHPHFNVTANVDISSYLIFLKQNAIPVSIGMVHLISTAANSVKEFRWRIRDNSIVEHKLVHPSFTVSTEEADVFSFCYADFISDPILFSQKAIRAQETMKSNPSFEDEEDRDDFLFLSSIPWIQFTSISHAMHYHPCDSVPRITWGKFFTHEDRTMMPLSVQVHHALVDGRHVGQYFQAIESIVTSRY